MVRGVVGLVVFVATFFWSMPAAGDGHPDPALPQQEWAEFATPAVLAEIAVLAELDAFQTNPLIETIRSRNVAIWGTLHTRSASSQVYFNTSAMEIK